VEWLDRRCPQSLQLQQRACEACSLEATLRLPDHASPSHGWTLLAGLCRQRRQALAASHYRR
jgi:hypothetical protein